MENNYEDKELKEKILATSWSHYKLLRCLKKKTVTGSKDFLKTKQCSELIQAIKCHDDTSLCPTNIIDSDETIE